MKQKIKNILFYIVTAFLIAYVGVSLFMPAKVIDVFGFQLSTVSTLTESMVPTIDPGDLIIITKVDDEEIKEDVVISFYNYVASTEGYTQIRVVHRIIEITDEGYLITQGDNNDYQDTIRDENGNIVSLTTEQVIGKYQFRIPYVGVVLSALRNPMLLLLVLVNVGIIVIIIKVVKSGKEEVDEKDGVA